MKFERQTIKFKIKNVKFKKKKKGFTLIELVAVLAIITILSTAFIPKFGKYITEAKKVAVLNEAKTVVTAYESVRHKLDNPNDIKIETLQEKDMPLNGIAINKIPLNFSVTSCQNLMDTENYNFDIDSKGKATEPEKINDSTSKPSTD